MSEKRNKEAYDMASKALTHIEIHEKECSARFLQIMGNQDKMAASQASLFWMMLAIAGAAISGLATLVIKLALHV